jgi:tetratricopeptide (TPR) repeat protein
MRRLLITLLPPVLLATAEAHADSTSADCSPIIEHVGGNVAVNCGGKAFDYLVEQINKKDADLTAKNTELQSWIDRYNALKQSLGDSQGYDQLRKEALAAFQNHDLDTAGRKLDAVIQREEHDLIGQIARDHYNRGEIFVFQQNANAAFPEYQRAFELEKNNPKYAAAYARSLCSKNKINEAREVLQDNVDQLQTLRETNNMVYQGSLVCAFVNLSGIYNKLGMPDESRTAADSALREARKLAGTSSDGEAKIHLADALSAHGAAQVKTGKIVDGKVELLQAEELYDEQMENNSNRPYIHQILAGVFKSEKDDTNEQTELLKALDFEERLLLQSPQVFRFRLSVDFRNLMEFLNRTRKTEVEALAFTNYITFINDPRLDNITTKFLEAAARDVRTTSLCLEGGSCPDEDINKPIDLLNQIAQRLAADESQTLALAIFDQALVFTIRGDYSKATSLIEKSIAIKPGFNPVQERNALQMAYVIKFFTVGFLEAAKAFLQGNNDLSEEDKELWRFVVSWRANSTGKQTIDPGKFPNLELRSLVLVLMSGDSRAKIDEVTARVRSSSPSPQKCKELFLIGEYDRLIDVPKDPENATSVCVPNVEFDPYSWIIKAETLRN